MQQKKQSGGSLAIICIKNQTISNKLCLKSTMTDVKTRDAQVGSGERKGRVKPIDRCRMDPAPVMVE